MEKFGGEGLRVESVMQTWEGAKKCQEKQELNTLSAKAVDLRYYALFPSTRLPSKVNNENECTHSVPSWVHSVIRYNSDNMEESDSQDLASQDIAQETPAQDVFIAPSIHEIAILDGASYTHHSAIPELITQDLSTECVLGIDEAGRGPVLGNSRESPMLQG